MTTLIAFDPGVHHVGWAVFNNLYLVQCGLLRERSSVGVIPALDEFYCPRGATVIIECPQVYQQASWKGDPADLIAVATVVGALAFVCRIGLVKLVSPHDWKGNAPKTATKGWLDRRLNPDEARVLNAAKCPASLRHNIIDAVALGLFGTGRLR